MPGFELIGKEERDAVLRVFDENQGVLFAHGFDKMRQGHFEVREFEKAFAVRFNVSESLAVSSGTAALKVALKAAGVGPGDEVITQAFNFIAAIEAIVDCGARPVIVNVDESLNMCPEDLKKKISDRTKAVVVVHMLGFAADMDTIPLICREKNLCLIEDNCEAIGAKWKSDHLGCIGDIGVFSLDFGKTITTGEGGMIVSKNAKLMKHMREYHDHGHENNPNLPRGRDTRKIPGFNYRMMELQAAIGKAQLKKLDFILEENKRRFETLEQGLAGLKHRLKFKNSTPGYDTFMVKTENPEQQEKIIKKLQELGFGTKNVPDAVEWHCAGYWDHLLSPEELTHAQWTKNLLTQYVAIPVVLKRTVEEYQDLVNKLQAL